METSGCALTRRNGRTLSCCVAPLLLLSLAGLGIGQEVEGNGKSSGAIFSPADYLEITTPVTSRVTVNTYEFYLGNLRTSIALLEVPTTLQKHFMITPGYLFVNVPPSGLSLLINRYRNKIYVSHPISLGSYGVNPFVFDEVYHDFAPGKWLRRNWFVAAVDMPINRHLTFQPSYIRQDDLYLRSVNFLGLALIIRTNVLSERKPDPKDAPANAAVE